MTYELVHITDVLLYFFLRVTDQTDHLAASLGDAAVFRCAVVEVCLTQTRSLGEEEVSHPASGLLWQPLVPGSRPRIYSVKYTPRVHPPPCYELVRSMHTRARLLLASMPCTSRIQYTQKVLSREYTVCILGVLYESSSIMHTTSRLVRHSLSTS